MFSEDTSFPRCLVAARVRGLTDPSQRGEQTDLFSQRAPELGTPDSPQTRLGWPRRIHMNDDAVDKQENKAGQAERAKLRNAGVDLVQHHAVVLAVDLVESVR